MTHRSDSALVTYATLFLDDVSPDDKWNCGEGLRQRFSALKLALLDYTNGAHITGVENAARELVYLIDLMPQFQRAHFSTALFDTPSIVRHYSELKKCL